MSRAVLSVGSNIEDRLGYLRLAVAELAPLLVAASPVYQTPPWGPVAQQPFLNAVLIAEDPAAAPGDWLARARACERQAGRRRQVRWGPRTLDVDVITVDAVTSDDPELTLPHPRAAERAFVLVPWLAADPDAELPGHGRVSELLARLPADELAAVQRLDGLDLLAGS